MKISQHRRKLCHNIEVNEYYFHMIWNAALIFAKAESMYPVIPQAFVSQSITWKLLPETVRYR